MSQRRLARQFEMRLRAGLFSFTVKYLVNITSIITTQTALGVDRTAVGCPYRQSSTIYNTVVRPTPTIQYVRSSPPKPGHQKHAYKRPQCSSSSHGLNLGFLRGKEFNHAIDLENELPGVTVTVSWPLEGAVCEGTGEACKLPGTSLKLGSFSRLV